MVTEGTLKTGEKVFVNDRNDLLLTDISPDYVYSAAPWEKRDPVPYSIGRIIEFIPPEEPGLEWLGSIDLLTFKIRESEIIDSYLPPSSQRLSLSQIFGGNDNYEVILASEIHNLPSQIKDVLVSRYEFVVCEREALPDLQDNLRLCETCGDWCPGPESVMCELCKKHYHMECVTPPLLSKPSRGYGWSCASCNNKRENNDLEVTTGKNRQNKDLQIAAMKARMKVKANSKLDEEEDKYWKGWSFRYFGYGYLDPDDMIYVRAPTRIGKQFQTAVPETPMGASTDPDIPVRGEDETVELMSAVIHMTESQVERRKNILTPRMDLQQNVDWIEEVIRRFSEAWVNKQSFYSWKDGKEQRYRDKDWSEIEEQIFDESDHARNRPAFWPLEDVSNPNEQKTRTLLSIRRMIEEFTSVPFVERENQSRGGRLLVICPQMLYATIVGCCGENMPSSLPEALKRRRTTLLEFKINIVNLELQNHQQQGQGASGTVTPSRLTCSLCRKSGPQGQVVKCVKCGFTIHSEEATPDWTCEICSNEQSLESNLLNERKEHAIQHSSEPLNPQNSVVGLVEGIVGIPPRNYTQ
ncbi:16125_t:CDS:10, partial [Acaulospora colombiana]